MRPLAQTENIDFPVALALRQSPQVDQTLGIVAVGDCSGVLLQFCENLESREKKRTVPGVLNALPLEWSRDPFDRLLVAHSLCTRIGISPDAIRYYPAN